MSGGAEVATRLGRVRVRIEQAAKRAGRQPDEVTLIGVAKRQPVELVAAAARAGLRDLGESYVQEAATKIPRLRDLLDHSAAAGLRWHLVGRLQRNKAREALRWFDVIHSLDRAELAEEIERRAERAGRIAEVLLQVNLSAEAQKGGVPPEGLGDLARRCAALGHLRVVGLMTLPAPGPDAEASRPAFAELRRLRDALAADEGGATLRELSMGMSDDFEVAIEEGATIVRVGTAIFGPREG